MASTTKTTNLKLSQFVGTDKPAWLTDYNGDMQKIDDGYKKLENANTATQADLDATKQDLSGSKTDIDDVKAEVQALKAQDIALGNRLTVVEGNYDTMHHEVAINAQSIDDIETDLGVDTPLNTTATTVHGAINEIIDDLPINDKWNDFYIYLSPSGSDDNDGKTENKPMKTIEAAISKYSYKAQNIYLYLAAGTYDINSRIRLRMPRIVFEGRSSSAANVIVNIKTDQVWASLLIFSKVTVNIDVATSLEANRIDFYADSILNLNENVNFADITNMEGNTINLNDYWLKISSGRSINVNDSCTINSGTGYINIIGGVGNIKAICPVHVNNGGVLYYKSGVTPVTASPYVAVQFS